MSLHSLGLLAASVTTTASASADISAANSVLSTQTTAHLVARYFSMDKLAQFIQLDEYSEFFVDSVPNPWSEEQWFEITPEWAEMFPGPSSPEATLPGSIDEFEFRDDATRPSPQQARGTEIKSLTSVYAKYRLK